MSKVIRKLTLADFPQVKDMHTGIEDDYIILIFEELIEEPHAIFGLFINEQLVSFAGYSIFADQYAMLGRLRSDLRFRGRGYATKVMSYALEQAKKIEGIKWIGANTQEDNPSARKVLEKIGLMPYPKLYRAITNDISTVITEAKPWSPIHDLNRKREWLQRTYINKSSLFPYECYYLFPAKDGLFSDEKLRKWSFYENETNTRFLITKKDYNKRGFYLHSLYPWDDLMEQEGLLETIALDLQHEKEKNNEDIYIWMDLPEETVQKLPHHHPFDLTSAWILHGIDL